VEAPPSRPRDDGLDPPRRAACHYRTPAVPAPKARIETKAGRSAMTTATCTGGNARSPPLPFPFRSRSSMTPALAARAQGLRLATTASG
jgi:hypothetical protein